MSSNRRGIMGGFEDSFEKGQSLATKTTKNTVSDFANTAKKQVVGDSGQKSAGDEVTNEAQVATQNSDQSQMSDADCVEYLSNLYGNSDSNNNVSKSDQKKSQKNSGGLAQVLGIPQKDKYEGKTPEEIAEIKVVEQKLHSAYYQDLVNRPKPKEEPVAEKLEREEQEQKMAELEDQKKKSIQSINPQIVKQGTGERILSTVG